MGMTIEEAIKELIDASHREAKYGDTNNHYYEIMMRIEAFDMAIKALEVVKGIEDAYMSELLKTPMERNVPISDPCDGCQYELNSTNGNPCYSCGKYKLTEKQPCEDYLKKRDKDYVHYNVKWLLDNWEQELELLSGGKIKPCDDCVSRQAVLDEKWTHTHPDGFAEEYVTVKDILELPSVTPSYNSIKTELEPCDDCISRKRLLARIDEERKHLLDIKMDGAEHIIVHHARRIIEDMPSVTPSIPDVENEFNIGYNCGYADAMCDISKSEE